MKMRRMLSVLLAVVIVISCAAVAGSVVASGADTDIAVTSAYQDMLAKTSAENGYGLASTVNDGTILQAWNWSFNNIKSLLPTLAEQGFTTIQVSPPNEIKAGTKGVKVLQSDGKNGWWMFYQPAGFQLNESTDNALGTKAEFTAMCTEAKTYGIKIIVDAVINHMGTCDNEDKVTSTNPMDHLTPKAAQFEPEIVNNKLFHTPWKEMQYIESNNTYYNSAYDLTRNCTSRLPDLKTDDTRVQTAIYDYLAELVEAGASGFRFDAAKHIETPDDHDGLGSSFWTNTLGKVRTNYPDCEVYAYGEILNTCGIDRPFSWYTKLFDVTDSNSYWGIKDSATNGGTADATPYYPNTNFTSANTILWDESHDTYMDGATTSLTTVQRGKIWALVAGRAGITTVYFARPNDGTNTNACYNVTLGDANKTSWSNATTKAINQFHNYFIGESEYCTSNQNGWAYIERGTKGVIIVHRGGSTSGAATLTNHKLAAGTYTDAITGNKFTVTKSQIKGNVGATGVACVYLDETTPTQPSTTPQPTAPPETVPGQGKIYGDVDGDNEVTIFDVTRIQRVLVGLDLDKKGEFFDILGDVDGSNEVEITDATYIQRFLAGMKETGNKAGTVIGGGSPVTPTTVTDPTQPDDPYIPSEDDPSYPEEPDYPHQDGCYTIIFSNSQSWSGCNLYYWASGEDGPVAWPGEQMTYYDTNEFGQAQYYGFVPEEYDCYIINAPSGEGYVQTVDCSVSGDIGVWPDSQNTEGKWEVGTWDLQ